jgi:hypothetical protein
VVEIEASEEVLKTLFAWSHVELFSNPAVWSYYGYPMFVTTHIDAHSYLPNHERLASLK